ncbi:hypothetical protein HHI36_010146 [Cryptolaemus montrouzieri]|uniref:Targeting protein for Xklp2 n=1 Tax=Cryptolaemus montrouzieri TaxID=559131 RepID=A0ABD2MHX2_9CUCU
MAAFDDLDAPQFSNFNDNDEEAVETFFEIDHESHFPKTLMESRNKYMNRCSSSDHLPNSVDSIRKSFEKVGLNGNAKNKFQYGKLTKSSSQSTLKWNSQDNLNRLAAPKNLHSSTGNLSSTSNQFVSVAEAVKKFQERTPTRFHSRNKNQAAAFQNDFPIKLKSTIPHSPLLLTKKRVKNGISVMSHEEREKAEFEEAQKYKVKAHPFNRKIFQPPLKAVHVEKKPVTVPEPFKLTKVEHKRTDASPKKEEYHFHARPVPKSVLETPKLPAKPPVKITIAVTPSVARNIPKASPVKKIIEKPCALPLKVTKPEPFSFEKRDMQILQKKEKLIKKVVEEEKKAREFHARPIPKPIASMIDKQKHKSLSSSATSSGEFKRSDENIHEELFKARPPTVLYQKPFEPKKVDHFLTEIQPFQLHSEMRAKEREYFEMKKKEQLEKAAELLREEEEERIRREAEEVKKLRKQIDFKANPIRNFKEIIIKPSNKLTLPISPVFRSGKSNKENLPNGHNNTNI